MKTATRTLRGYEMLGIEGLLDYLRQNSPKNEQDFAVEEIREIPSVSNPFNEYATSINIEDRRAFQIVQITPNQGLVSRFFGVSDESENLIATVYAERGIAGYYEEVGEFNSAYEFMKVKFPQWTELPSGSRIPKATVKLQLESDSQGNTSLERRDHIRTFGFLWLRTNLDETLPDKLFLANPDIKYKKVQSR
jgi:hypothetical protein